MPVRSVAHVFALGHASCCRHQHSPESLLAASPGSQFETLRLCPWLVQRPKLRKNYRIGYFDELRNRLARLNQVGGGAAARKESGAAWSWGRSQFPRAFSARSLPPRRHVEAHSSYLNWQDLAHQSHRAPETVGIRESQLKKFQARTGPCESR